MGYFLTIVLCLVFIYFYKGGDYSYMLGEVIDGKYKGLIITSKKDDNNLLICTKTAHWHPSKCMSTVSQNEVIGFDEYEEDGIQYVKIKWKDGETSIVEAKTAEEQIEEAKRLRGIFSTRRGNSYLSERTREIKAKQIITQTKLNLAAGQYNNCFNSSDEKNFDKAEQEIGLDSDEDTDEFDEPLVLDDSELAIIEDVQEKMFDDFRRRGLKAGDKLQVHYLSTLFSEAPDEIRSKAIRYIMGRIASLDKDKDLYLTSSGEEIVYKNNKK